MAAARLSHPCPCCKAPMPAGVVPREELAGRLDCSSPIFLRVVSRLAWRPGQTVEWQALADYVWRDDPDGGPLRARSTIYSCIDNHRAKLHPLGWKIETRWGVGFRLELR